MLRRLFELINNQRGNTLGQAVMGVLGIGIALLVPGGATLYGTMIGLSIGLSVGGILFPPDMQSQKPEPGTLQLQTSQYGTPVPVVYGTRKIAGNLIWYDNFQSHEDEEGGKGGGGGGYTTYTYSVGLAFGLCMAPEGRRMYIRRAWAGKDEISLCKLTRYDGSQTEPDSYVAGFTPRDPVWKNLCYVVLRDYDLGNSTYIPNFTFEVSPCPPPPEGDCACYLYPPSDLTAECQPNHTVTLTWVDNSSDYIAHNDNAVPENIVAWAAETVKTLNELVNPTVANGYYYKCTVDGTTGLTEPIWPTTSGDTIVDGTVTWICMKKANEYECNMDEDGFEIWKSEDGFIFEYVGETESSPLVEPDISTLVGIEVECNVKTFFKVRAFKEIEGGRQYSPWSNIDDTTCSWCILSNLEGPSSVAMGGQAQYTVEKECVGTVVWSTNKGSITQGGLLTASCCPCDGLVVTVECGDASLSKGVAVVGDCSALTIVNEDGSPATGTMPWGSQLDFKTTGYCCGTIVWGTDKGHITQGGVLTADCCPCGSIHITASCEACGTSADHNITVTGDCSELAIVNENGTPATDTILSNGQLDFKTTGDCCGGVVWTVSGAGVGSSTITQGGLLTAGADACGSLLVTATCEACGTSATQYVRVTDAGQWVWQSQTTNDCYALFTGSLTCIIGDTKNVYVFNAESNGLCANTCPNINLGGCPILPYSCAVPSYCYFQSGYEFIDNTYCLHVKAHVIYKWQC